MGFTSNAGVSGGAYMGCQALTLGCLLIVALESGLPALLERVAERLLPKELIAILEEVAEIAMGGQLQRAVGASRAAVTAWKEVKERDRVTWYLS